MQLERAAGILLHPTSLPSRYGIGDLGENAFKFIDFLVHSRQKLWQILPLNPVGYGESPYQAYSAFAGNHLLIDPVALHNQGLLTDTDLVEVPEFCTHNVDFSAVITYKIRVLQQAYWRFQERSPSPDYYEFIGENAFWLQDYALFMALKEYYGGLPWQQWEADLACREEEVLKLYRSNLQSQVEFHYFLQYIFAKQWQSLRNYANSQGVKIIGDLPIFVAADSCDTWVNPQLFELDQAGNPLKVAGVPPDYFSKTGQRWGNPLYRWDVMLQDNYHWWRKRVKQLLGKVDFIRFDHFRGFEAYWKIPEAEATAVNGQWVKGPGEGFFTVLEKYLGQLPIIAEDLGYITSEVQALKEAFEFPGMKVLQFINEEKLVERPQLENIVYYTGTHDNDTLLGWYDEKIRVLLDRPTGSSNICGEFIEVMYRSNAAWVVIPLQDILGLGSEARMNTPGTSESNWRWRLEPNVLNETIEQRLAELSWVHSR